MKVAPKFLNTVLTLSALALAASFAAAQAPYLLPYTIQTLAGGGTAPTAGSACVGAPASTSYDAFGDGCPVTSSSIVVGSGADVHDAVVDQQGNVYFLDNASNGVVRRIDGRTGLITIYYGSLTLNNSNILCAASTDKYGDGCPANDGKANATGGYTANDSKARGLAIAPNGDLYIASYSGNAIHKVSLATGLATPVAGFITGTGKVVTYTGVKGYTGDGGQALSAEVYAPRGVALDAAGNIYIADSSNHVIRKVTLATGVITTIAGSTAGAAGSAGDNGPATAATFNTPEGIALDAAGNIFIADQGNARIRVIYTGGTAVATLIARTNAATVAVAGNIYTIAGSTVSTAVPTTTNAGPVLATSVPIGGPRKLSVDSRDNVFFSDNGNNVVWFLDASTGSMRVIAGTLGLTTGGAGCGQKTYNFGDGCPATSATLYAANAMSAGLDNFGQLYITDTGDARLRKVYTNQAFPAVAVGASVSQVLFVHFPLADGPAVTNPYTITGSADFTVASSTCNVPADGSQDCLVTVRYTPTVAGREAANFIIASRLNGSSLVGISGSGVAAAVAIDPGSAASFATTLNNPFAIAQDNAGNYLVADTGSNRILRVGPGGGTPTIVAGTGTAGYAGDGASPNAATLNAPKSVAVSRNGAIYIADTGNNVIRRIDPLTGFIATIAGGSKAICAQATDTFGDGCPGTAATLNAPAGLAADPDGNIYIADTGNNILRELSFSGYISYVAGNGTPCASTSGNGVDTLGNNCLPSQSIFAGPTGLSIDSARNLYVADTGNNEVRELTVSPNLVVRVAGNGQPGASGNGGTANTALLTAPTGVSTDAAGNVYIADTGNSAVRVVNGGIINSIVGVLGTAGTGSLPAAASAVSLTTPQSVISTGIGTLVVLDSGNNRALTDNRGSLTYNFGRTNLGAMSPTLQIQETSTGSTATTIATPFTTNTGDTTQFTLLPTGSSGCTSPSTLAPGASCLLIGQFVPTSLGGKTATYTEATTNTINNPAPFITLVGTGATLTPTTSATVVNGSPTFAVPFTVTTTVTPATCNTAAPSCFPTGTVTFFADSIQQGNPVNVANGAATGTISGLTVGSHVITAVYSGDNFYAASSAPAVTVVLAPAPTVTTVSASPATSAQFTNLVLTAAVTGPTSNSPTGTVAFYAGTMLLGTVQPLSPSGVAVDADVTSTVTKNGVTTTTFAQSFHLPAGVYALTAVYSGDKNYAVSTSAPVTLTITPDPASGTLSLTNGSLPIIPASIVSAIGTAQGATAQVYAAITPTNTVNGSFTFACTGMPAHSDCTFQPITLTFAPVPGVPTTQQTQVTFFTDVPPIATAVNAQTKSKAMLATLAGWPILLSSFLAVFTFRKRLHHARLLAVLALFGILTGGSIVLSGCSSAQTAGSTLTPTGTYQVTVTAKGPNNLVLSAPVTFTVAPGIPGQE